MYLKEVKHENELKEDEVTVTVGDKKVTVKVEPVEPPKEHGESKQSKRQLLCE